MRLAVSIALLLLPGCINATCQHLQDAYTTNANACGAMPPTAAALQLCDSQIGQCTASDVSALNDFATCLAAIDGCGQLSTNPNDPQDSPAADCSKKVANISEQCGAAISPPMTDSDD